MEAIKLDELSQEPLLEYIRNNCHAEYSSFTIEITNTIREVGVRNMFIQQKLKDLIQKFEGEKISVVILKGSHLIHDIYPFGIRPLEDIDLLLQRKDFILADQIIRDMGYSDCSVGLDIWTHLQFSNKITYTNHTMPFIPIDIHFSLGPYPYLGRLNGEMLFESYTEKLATPSGEYNVLQTEILLIHLCLHLFQHHNENWQKSGCDIIAVILDKHDSINWDRFNHIVKENKLNLPVVYSLNKASELAPKKIIPTSVLNEIGNKKLGEYEQIIFNLSKRHLNTMEKHLLQFITTPSFTSKLQCLLRIIFPRRSFLNLHFSGSYVKYFFSILKTFIYFLKTVFSQQ